MGPRPRRVRPSIVLCVIGVVVGGVLAVPGAAGAISDADCTALASANLDQAASNDDLEALAAQADGLEGTADELDDAKVKKGLRTMAAVYRAASEADNSKAAGLLFAKQSRKWAKGYKPYAKALNACLVKSVEDIPKP